MICSRRQANGLGTGLRLFLPTKWSQYFPWENPISDVNFLLNCPPNKRTVTLLQYTFCRFDVQTFLFFSSNRSLFREITFPHLRIVLRTDLNTLSPGIKLTPGPASALISFKIHSHKITFRNRFQSMPPTPVHRFLLRTF